MDGGIVEVWVSTTVIDDGTVEVWVSITSVWRRDLRVNELCLAGDQNTHLHSQVLGTASPCTHKQTTKADFVVYMLKRAGARTKTHTHTHTPATQSYSCKLHVGHLLISFSHSTGHSSHTYTSKKQSLT